MSDSHEKRSLITAKTLVESNPVAALKPKEMIMSVLTLEGVVESGRIRLMSSLRLPEKERVFVVIPEMSENPVAYSQPWGILGRNVLNAMPILLNGPALVWEEWRR